MSFTYNGISSDGYLKELKVTQSILPPSDNTLQSVVGRSGAFFIRKTHGVRKIEIEVVIIGTSQPDFRSKVRQIAEWLDSETPQPLIFSDEPDKQYFAIVDGETDLDQLLSYGTGKISFICPDPFAYKVTETTVQLTAGGTKQVDYAGTARVFPIITATCNSPTTLFEVTRGDDFGNNDKVDVEFSFQAGDVVEINMSKGTVKINGTMNLPTITLDSNFWYLEPKGLNYIWSSAGFTASMKYNEKFK